MTPSRPGSRRPARYPTVNFGAPVASNACTTPEYWSPTNTVEPPGVTAPAWGNRNTPASGGSPMTDAVIGAAGAAAAASSAISMARAQARNVDTTFAEPARTAQVALECSLNDVVCQPAAPGVRPRAPTWKQ